MNFFGGTFFSGGFFGALTATQADARPRPADNEKKRRRLYLPVKPTGLIDRPLKPRVFAEAPSVEQRAEDSAIIARWLADTTAREQAIRDEVLLMGMEPEVLRTEEIRKLMQLALEEEEEEILMLLAMES